MCSDRTHRTLPACPGPGSPPRRRHRERGSLYLYVLASSLLVTILGLGALAAVRIQMRSARLTRDCAEARTCAVAAIELGLRQIKQNPDWRTTLPNGVWLADKQLGNGRLTLMGTDPTDGVLSDSKYEPLVLTGIGTRGVARHQVQVTLQPVVKPLAALSTCLCSSGLLKTSAGKRLTALGAPVSTNGQLDNDGTLDGDAQAQSLDHTGIVTGTLTVPGTSRPMPEPDVFTTYAAKATAIPYMATMEDVVLGPGCNPLGSSDPNGLYLIDTRGSNITLRNMRLYGTLIIMAGGQTVTVDDAVLMQNYRSDFPVLLVDGNLTIKPKSVESVLSEPARSTNFNPVGAPYKDVCDSDTADLYPDEIRGLVHVKGSLKLQQTARLVGVVICEGTVTCEEANTILYDAGLYAHPPQGYTYVDGMKIVPGTWKQIVE